MKSANRSRWLRPVLMLLLLLAIPARLRADMAPEYRLRGKAALSADLIAACLAGRVQEARSLLNRGASPTWGLPARYQIDAFDENNGPALTVAIAAGQIEVLRMLLDERKALVQSHAKQMFYELLSPKSWRSPSASQQAALLKLLIDRKIDVNAKLDSDGTTPLMLAAVRGNSDAVQQLLLAGADAGRKNANGQTALTLARAVKKPQPGHPAVIQLLAPLTH